MGRVLQGKPAIDKAIMGGHTEQSKCLVDTFLEAFLALNDKHITESV